MPLLSLTPDTLDAAVRRHALLVLECSPDRAACLARATSPGVAHVPWAHVDTRHDAPLARWLGLSHEAGLLIWREQVILYRQDGLPETARVAELLARIAALDMRAVHADLEAQCQAALALHMRRACPTARRGRPIS